MNKTIRYLGRTVNLNIQFDDTVKKPIITEHDNTLTMVTDSDDGSKILEAIQVYYQRRLKKMIEAFVKQYQPNFKVKPRKVSVKSSYTKWGSCSSERDLMFNWQLMIAPEGVIEYVVVHEMCHMVHMNHDRSFWRLVGKLMPDYKKHEDWLKFNHQEV